MTTFEKLLAAVLIAMVITGILGCCGQTYSDYPYSYVESGKPHK